MAEKLQRWGGARGLSLGIAITALVALHLLFTHGDGLSNDATMQWAQVTSNRLNDWHPPAMTRLWQLLRGFGDGAGPLSVLSVSLYWAGFGLFALGFVRLGRPGLDRKSVV